VRDTSAEYTKVQNYSCVQNLVTQWKVLGEGIDTCHTREECVMKEEALKATAV